MKVFRYWNTSVSYTHLDVYKRQDVFYVRVDRTRKVPITVLIRALGVSSNEEIVELFGDCLLYRSTNGPAGGGGAVKRVSEIGSVCSIFVPRDAVEAKFTFREV